MDKKLLTAIAIVLSVVILAAAFYFVVRWLDSKEYCVLESPLQCGNPILGPDGLVISIGSVSDETIYVQDITISPAKGPKCTFLQPSIVDIDKDYYFTLSVQEAITFFMASDHPDGACFQSEWTPGRKYDYEIEIAYFLDGEKLTSKGKGRVFYGTENVSGELSE